jgi:hypothetical protein
MRPLSILRFKSAELPSVLLSRNKHMVGAEGKGETTPLLAWRDYPGHISNRDN